MERLCYTFDIRADAVEEYERRHARLWPELESAMKESGFSNYSLFRRGLEVIAYCECEPTVAEALATLSAYDVSERWNAYIRSLMTRAVDADGKFFRVSEIWHLD